MLTFNINRHIISLTEPPTLRRVACFRQCELRTRGGLFLYDIGCDTVADIKPFLSYEQQIQHLSDIGLIIENKDFAISVLSEINYYRLVNAYSLGLYVNDEKKGRYKDGVTFFQIYDLYRFDTDLRHILSEQLEEFEILFRTKVAYYIGLHYGALGYIFKENFESEQHHNEFMDEFYREKERQSKSPIVKHHNENYDGSMRIWTVVEILSFGTVSKLYKNMNYDDRVEIAKDFGVGEVYLKSWLRSFVEIRNICAHYGRLYNKQLLFPPKLFKGLSFSNNRIFSVLFLLKRYISPENWVSQMLKLKRTIEQHKSVDLQQIGFPENWQEILNNVM